MQKFNSKFKNDLKLRTYKFSLGIIALMDDLPQKISAWIIQDQLIRSATSVGANLVEARASSSRVEFKKFFEISLKSANETKYWLCLLRDTQLANKSKIEEFLEEIAQISNMIAKSVMSLKKK